MMLFPRVSDRPGPVTRLIIDDESDPERLPVIRWAGVTESDAPAGLFGLLGPVRGSAPLVEHSRGSFERPGLRGHRLSAAPGGAHEADPRDLAGRSWTTAFRPVRVSVQETELMMDAEDAVAGLALRTEMQALPGGAVRARHTVTNQGPTPYLLEALELSLPLPADAVEILDFTGRHEFERAPQRHAVADGIWLRESRGGRPGLDGTGVVAVGTGGFTFDAGELLTVSVACSGNSAIAVERSGAAGPSVAAGELLLPGEVVLLPGGTYTMPWVVVSASAAGLDPAAQALHAWQRTLPAHPARQPVTLNVWEAVYFDHDLDQLKRLADLAARVGVERFVLDDGWFHDRRDDTSGLGDWWVDEQVWPDGLGALVDHVHRLGLQFGLWFEPEMVNPDSDLYRAHPDWILAAQDRLPLQARSQYVLDITNPEVLGHLRDRIDKILAEYQIDYVKWDHNRDLLEAGSSAHGHSPAAHAQYLAFYTLLDELTERHPRVHWESCASGGGRVDLGVIERVQRFWTSDMTDAVARQSIQRWTGQMIAPEYLGAHISAPTSHQTGRTLSLDFRAATAFFLAFGIEWDLTAATEAELDELADWCARHKQHRSLLHSGRVVRIDTGEPGAIAHGVVADDASEAIVGHAQLDDAHHNRGTTLRLPGLTPDAAYRLDWLGPVDRRRQTNNPAPAEGGPTEGAVVTGQMLAGIGIWLPRRAPFSALLIHVRRA